MARRLRPVELDFAASAPLRLVFTTGLAAPPAAVYRSLAVELASTPAWFSAVRSATPTHGGAGRTVRLKGGVEFRETILATDPAARYAYRVDETNVPGLSALLEEWVLSPTADGTRVRWTMAVDGNRPCRVAMRLARPGVGKSFRDAMRNLERRLTPARHPSPGSAPR
ncbi:SRPBCC family protein [Streptomyces sp. NPDC093111]|uniref:SRPBCC family protein n=1 Tax=Streptomyces sp. NPDC093111 TaxID=3154978 RepID=UPI0034392BBE